MEKFEDSFYKYYSVPKRDELPPQETREKAELLITLHKINVLKSLTESEREEELADGGPSIEERIKNLEKSEKELREKLILEQ
jgi:hypothetical protein